MFAEGANAALNHWVRLGFPSPNATPAISNMDVALEDEVLAEYTNALYTYVRERDTFVEESLPSMPTETVLVNIGNSFIISGIEPAPEECRVTSIRLYLYHKGSFAGGETSNPKSGGYFLAGEVAPNSTSGVALFGNPLDGLMSEDYEPPPWGLIDISSWRTGQFAGLTTYNTLAFSIPNIPHAWRQADQMTFYGRGIRFIAGTTHGYVLTDKAPFIVKLNAQCDGPQCHKGEHLPTPLPIIARMSAAMYGDMVIYATTRGLASIEGGKSQIFPIWDDSSWAALNPDTMVGCVHDGHYYGFTDVASFRVKLDGDVHDALIWLSDTDVTAAAVTGDGRLMVAKPHGIEEMFRGTEFREFTWRRTWLLLERMNLSAFQIRTRYQNASITHTYDGEIIDEDEQVGDDPERLPLGDTTDRLGVEIRSTGEVTQYTVATSLRELAMR